MSNDKRPFVRVYHDDLMRDYPEVYGDDAALATWLRLLVIADRMWPTPPELPRSAKGRGLTLLRESGLIEVQSHCYRIRGYDKERQSRQDAGRNAAAMRWHPEGNAPRTSSTEYRVPSTNNVVNAREKRRPGLTRVGAILPDIKGVS